LFSTLLHVLYGLYATVNMWNARLCGLDVHV